MGQTIRKFAREGKVNVGRRGRIGWMAGKLVREAMSMKIGRDMKGRQTNQMAEKMIKKLAEKTGWKDRPNNRRFCQERGN